MSQQMRMFPVEEPPAESGSGPRARIETTAPPRSAAAGRGGHSPARKPRRAAAKTNPKGSARSAASGTTKAARERTTGARSRKPAAPRVAQPTAGKADAAAEATGGAPDLRAVPRSRRRAAAAETAQSLARKQREISVSEFFTKNRHLLGFDNPTKALLTTIKEAVDNSLDACEEAHILPSLRIEITRLEETRYRIAVQDNGPGIVKTEIPKIFGKLLYGSKFHRLKQARGQQGIGISAAGMYGQLTTGQPVRIVSRAGRKKQAHFYAIAIDTQRNAPEVIEDRVIEWDQDHGTRVELDIEAVYKKGRRSVDDYVAQTAVTNPHAEIVYQPPEGEPVRYERITKTQPHPPIEIKPHPYGVELGALLQGLRLSKSRYLKSALVEDFSRISPRVAEEICTLAGVPPRIRPKDLTMAQVESIFKAIPRVKILSPPADCLSPVGEKLILSAMRDRIPAAFYTALTRPPSVYRGNPFQVEVGVAYGGDLPGDELIDLMRFANRVPLQYQQSGCAITKSAMSIDWRKYALQQSRGALPTGPMVLMVNLTSVWVPFTSESKEAIAHYPEIVREIRLALQECGRKTAAHIRHHRRVADEAKKRSYIEKYIPHIGYALQEILGLSDTARDQAIKNLSDILERSRKV